MDLVGIAIAILTLAFFAFALGFIKTAIDAFQDDNRYKGIKFTVLTVVLLIVFIMSILILSKWPQISALLLILF